MKRKYSILHLINSIEPGGSENLLLNQVRYINMSIFDIHIGYLSGSGRNFNVVSSVKINDFSKQGRFSFLSIFRIWNYARKNRIEIIHTHLIQASLIGRLVAAITPGIKCVTTRHYARTLKSERLINRLEEFGERHSSAVVCISEYVKNYLIRNRFSPAILRVIYNAIDVEHFQCDGASIKKEKIIGTIGRLTEQKGIDILLKAFKQVLGTHPDIRLHILGDGPARETLVNLVCNLRISDKVEFIYKVLPSEIPLFLQKLTLFVLASRWEAFGIVMIEANASGLPVIASNIEAIPEIIVDGKNGLLVKPEDVNDLVEKICYMLDNPQKIQEMGRAGRLRVEQHFDIKCRVKDLENLYLEIIQQGLYE